VTVRRQQALRYGENPHQRGGWYVPADETPWGLGTLRQLQGKELSYNNLLDLDAAVRCLRDFTEPACAIVKHHGSATLGRASVSAVFHGQRNLEWMYVKNTPASLLVRTLPGHLLYNVASAAYCARVGLLGAFLKAKLAAVRGLPGILRKRAAIQRTRTVGAGAIEQHLERRWLSAKVREKHFDIGLAEVR